MCSSQGQKQRVAFLAGVSFVSAILLELLLEAAARHAVAAGVGTAAALLLTCGEFAGCCVVALACGGDLHGRRDGELLPGSRRARSRQGSFMQFWLPYVMLASLLLSGTFCANFSVTWVQFPLKVMIKSSKLVLVMAVSTAFGNSRAFSSEEYMTGLALCVGNAMFSYGSGENDAPPTMVALGVCMLLAASLGDVVAVNAQQLMMQKHAVPAMSLMLRQNFISFLGSCALLAASGGLWELLLLAPGQLCFAAAVGLCTGTTVWANTYLIKEAGSVQQVAVSSLRKVATVTLSYVVFPKDLSRTRGLAALLVAGALCSRLRTKPSPPLPSQKMCRDTTPSAAVDLQPQELAPQGKQATLTPAVIRIVGVQKAEGSIIDFTPKEFCPSQ
eukprot:TRINITY_DN76244_c0_g1_i1.p1 TRINITY_DN76244_c0_g1~~TRINITY_DN76244_c0_g1_i1.p1  ORF type:complete len:387 (+),score=68.19 TRINITY_DN76244_c0_g1_i1:72-1232(+)